MRARRASCKDWAGKPAATTRARTADVRMESMIPCGMAIQVRGAAWPTGIRACACIHYSGLGFWADETRQGLGYAACPTSFELRSEEHTSELQSLRHLVCRLLLEKK